MKLILLLLTAVMVGYLSGLMVESAVEGENSKFYSLVTTGEFNEQWIPFSLSPKINEFVGTYGVLTASSGFLQNAEMSGTLDYTQASIDFVISTERRTSATDGKYLVNRISECVFEADDVIDTTCIICKLKNGTGHFIANGTITTTSYDPVVNGSLNIPMMEYLETVPPMEFEQDITDVRNVHGVKLEICVPVLPPCDGDDDDDDGGIGGDDDDDGGRDGFHNSQSGDDDDGGVGGDNDDDGDSSADDDDGGFGIDDDDGFGGNDDDNGAECGDDDDDGGAGGDDDDDGGAGGDDDDDGGNSGGDDDDDGAADSGDDDDDGDSDDDDDD